MNENKTNSNNNKIYYRLTKHGVWQVMNKPTPDNQHGTIEYVISCEKTQNIDKQLPRKLDSTRKCHHHGRKNNYDTRKQSALVQSSTTPKKKNV